MKPENLNLTEELKPVTWQELKAFVNSIPEDKLNNVAHLMFSDESEARPVLEPFFTEHDYYYHKDDHEDCGTIEELKVIHGEDFNQNDYKLGTKAGTPFLWAE